MPNLGVLRTQAENLHTAFEALVAAKFPGAGKWHWFRACSHIRGENVRRNDDTSHDAAMALMAY